MEEHADVPVAELIAERMAYAADMRKQANDIRLIALKAAQETLLEARQEPGNDPAIVDEVLRIVDRMLIVAKRDS